MAAEDVGRVVRVCDRLHSMCVCVVHASSMRETCMRADVFYTRGYWVWRQGSSYPAPLAISNSHIQQLLPCASMCTGEISSCTTLWCMCVRHAVLVVCVLSDVLVAQSVRAVSSAPDVLVEQSVGVLLCSWTCRFFTGSAGHCIALYSRYSMCIVHNLVNGVSYLPKQGTRGKYCGLCQFR